MSSISIDASGARALSTTINDQARTYASIPTKDDDDLQIQVGGAGEISIAVPMTAKVRVLKDGDREVVFLKLPGHLSALAYNTRRVDPEGPSGWPHATISARKDAHDYYADREILHEVTFGDLIGKPPWPTPSGG